jgi:hypothetical protein
VIDHSVQVNAFGSADALKFNEAAEMERNKCVILLAPIPAMLLVLYPGSSWSSACLECVLMLCSAHPCLSVRERFQFLKWGSKAFENLSITPPGSGIVHQVR